MNPILRHIFTIIIATASVSSCVMNEDAISVDTPSISYQTVVGAMLKADDSSIYPEDGKFMSVAFLNETLTEPRSEASYYITPDEVAWRNGYWTTRQTYYWPENGFLTFLSYSPSQTPFPVEMDRDGVRVKGWSILEPSAVNCDFMVADVMTGKTYENSSSGVPTIFRHKLTRVLVSAKAVNAGTGDTSSDIVIKSIGFSNIHTSADYRGGSNSATDTWSDLTTNWTDTWTPNTGADISTSFTIFTSDEGMTLTTGDDFTQLGESCLMIPQTLASNTSLDIVFTEDGKEQSISLGMSGTSPEWEIGHSIHYTLEFRVGNIEMGATTGNWGDASGGSITIGDKTQ